MAEREKAIKRENKQETEREMILFSELDKHKERKSVTNRVLILTEKDRWHLDKKKEIDEERERQTDTRTYGEGQKGTGRERQTTKDKKVSESVGDGHRQNMDTDRQ